MIIIPVRSPEQLQAEAEWLARQPCWLQRAYVSFYGSLFLATIGIVAWAASMTVGR